MPPFEEHLVTSKARTGYEHRDVHEWLDQDPERKAERHDPRRVHENARWAGEEYGREAREEFLLHIREDIMGDLGKADVELLRGAGVVADDIRHCLKVAEKALELATRIGAAIDLELVGRGALFHDLGKARTHEIGHGRIGAGMGRELGLPEAVLAIMEKHIRGGLTADEAVELGLPVKDYTLATLEERVVIYADRLVDIITEDVVDLGGDEREAERRFEEILRGYPRYGKNDITLERYLGYHAEIQALIEASEREWAGKPAG
ncbi:MAG: HDIG domain-containing metalloprotein [Thermoleophilia bacterium]